MGTLFFSIDVETSGPNPAVGELLTLGAVPVLEDGTVLEDEHFYARLDYPLGPRWEAATRQWWLGPDSSEEAKRAAFGRWEERDGRLLCRVNAALTLEAWVSRLSTGLGASPCFVAHPVAFDWQWVDELMWSTLSRNVFGYKGLCLRSFGFGLGPVPWEGDRTDEPDLYFVSELPHHALHDARAQARQLSRMLRLRAGQTP